MEDCNMKILDNYYEKINKLIIDSRKQVRKNINTEMVELYYKIGFIINGLI